jgi:hypothetical protein
MLAISSSGAAAHNQVVSRRVMGAAGAAWVVSTETTLAIAPRSIAFCVVAGPRGQAQTLPVVAAWSPPPHVCVTIE